MPTYLYCVRSDAGEVPRGLAGIDGALVRSIQAATLFAWVSDARGPSVDVTVERVRAHDAVCAAALCVGDTPLPIRFGQSFSDDRVAAQAIITRHDALQSRLARVSGCVELRFVVRRGREQSAEALAEPAARSRTGEAEAEPTAIEGPGTAFLRRLARAGRADIAREVGCEEVRHAVREAARHLVVDQQSCEAARGVSFFPVLVRRHDVGELRAAVAGMSQAIDLSVLGPFAPYSFAGDA